MKCHLDVNTKFQTLGVYVSKKEVNDMDVKNIHGLTTISLLAP